MSIRNAKDEIIKEIRDLRTIFCNIYGKLDTETIEEMQRQLNKIQDKVFNI